MASAFLFLQPSVKSERRRNSGEEKKSEGEGEWRREEEEWSGKMWVKERGRSGGGKGGEERSKDERQEEEDQGTNAEAPDLRNNIAKTRLPYCLPLVLRHVAIIAVISKLRITWNEVPGAICPSNYDNNAGIAHENIMGPLD